MLYLIYTINYFVTVHNIPTYRVDIYKYIVLYSVHTLNKFLIKNVLCPISHVELQVKTYITNIKYIQL